MFAAVAALTLSAPVSAVAADLPRALPVKAPVMAPVVYNWTGFYVGGNVGYSWGRSRSDVTFIDSGGVPIVAPAGSTLSNNFNLNGGVAGGQVGYNWQAGNWVFGLETDLQWSGERGSAVFTCAAVAVTAGPCLPRLTFVPAGATGTSLTADQKINWFGTFRARAGMLVTPSILAYVTGGLAYGSVNTAITLATFTPVGNPSGAMSSSSATHSGWTVGGGIEAMFGGNWSGKFEYLYMDLGTFNDTVASTVRFAIPPGPAITANFSSHVSDHIFRVGINYHFTPEAVVARY